jgi:hypothetical protein
MASVQKTNLMIAATVVPLALAAVGYALYLRSHDYLLVPGVVEAIEPRCYAHQIGRSIKQDILLDSKRLRCPPNRFMRVIGLLSDEEVAYVKFVTYSYTSPSDQATHRGLYKNFESVQLNDLQVGSPVQVYAHKKTADESFLDSGAP